MRTVPLFLLLALPVTLTAAIVRVGDNLDTVRASLGTPRGQVRAGDRLLLYFDHGEVVLQSGTVTRVSLLSEEEQATRDARRTAIAERIREENASQGATGEALKARQLASATFRSAPLAYQVSFWEDFSRRYPGVSCTEQLTIARMSLAEQLEEKRARSEHEARLAELEARVVAAEALASQVSFYDLPGRSYNRGYQYRAAAPVLWPIEYRLYDFPIPATSSPGMPPIIPTYHGIPQVSRNSNDDWRDESRGDCGRGRDHNSDRGRHRSNGRNRF